MKRAAGLAKDPTISSDDVKEILKEVGREISTEKFGHLRRELELIQESLNSSGPSLRAELLELERLKKVLERAVKELNPKSNPALVSAGDIYAIENGPHPGIPIRSLKLYDVVTKEEVAEGGISYQSEERIYQIISLIEEVLRWLALVAEMRPPVRRRNSFHVDVIGELLPQIYERIFEVKFTASIKGPGTRFIRAVLAKMPLPLANDKRYGPETIIKYKYTAKNRAKNRATKRIQKRT
jgi:hypothetical protein